MYIFNFLHFFLIQVYICKQIHIMKSCIMSRLLYQWVCAPSCNLSVIRERQEAVKALFDNQELCQEAKTILTTLPDLERLLAK